MSGAVERPRAALAARRYPAMAYLVGAVALALLLPSGLTLPNEGPSTLAEYAPVPGRGEGSGDVAAFGQVSSRGVGSRTGSGGSNTTTVADEATVERDARIVRKPGTKRCVGNPPRQTEDPLSPPCVAFFEGDNGGASYKGVTAEEVTVVVRFDFVEQADPNRGRVIDCSAAPEDGEPLPDSLCKAYQRYFNDRYQTYGRTVRLISPHNVPLSQVFAAHDVFAVAEGTMFTQHWKERRVGVAFTGTTHQRALQGAPYEFTFRPDDEHRLDLVASYICLRLADRPARYAGDPALRTRERRFGIVYWKDEATRRTLLKQKVRDRCGEVVDQEAASSTDSVAMARMQANGVTSVVLMLPNGGNVTATSTATSIGFFPEWVIAAPATLHYEDTNTAGRQANQAQWANAFGVSLDVRRAALVDQPWYRAYREACPDCREPNASDQGVLDAASMYDSLAMLFYGIQAGGPRLTPQSVDKGLHSIPARPSDDPFRPAAYFTRTVGGFLKDAMEIRWDPAGRPPGGAATGCYRLPGAGARFRPGEWPAGDTGIGAQGPCQGDTFS